MMNSRREALAVERTDLARDRTRLANKRTFLAWCRTALSFMAFGFLLEKIDVFVSARHTTEPAALLTELGLLGKTTFVAAPLLILIAGYRFFQLEKALGAAKPGHSILPEMVLVMIIMTAALGYVFL